MADSRSPNGDVDMGWLGCEVDGEDEPLFADDVMDDEDDPPPLPPPMPSLGELAANRSRIATGHTSASNGVVSGANGTRGGAVFQLPDTQQGGDAGASGDGAATAGSAGEPTQKKRKPILTLKTERVFSEKGLRYVEKEFPKLKFRGKGHEAADLKYLMQQYEHWGNMLYPKLTFKDLTDRIEALASKRDFKSQLYQMRRRAARGERYTPPLHSDDSDQDEEGDGARGADSTSKHSSNLENEAPRDNDQNEIESGDPGTATDSGLANRVHSTDTVVVGGTNSDDVTNNGDVMDGSNIKGDAALHRLTMDAFGSSDEEI